MSKTYCNYSSLNEEEISFLKAVIARAAEWFPYFREMLRMEKLSEEHKQKFTTEKAGIQVKKDQMDKTKLVLCVNGQPIEDWLRSSSRN